MLVRWMADRREAITDLNERCVGEFLAARRAHGRTCRGVRRTALMLLEQLRCAGAIPTPEPARDDSPVASLRSQYEVYLRQERALTEGTISEYVSIADTFVRERLPEAGPRLDALGAADVHDFLLARVARLAPKRAQYLGSALRSFLRFLFMRGETRTDLALAVLTVRRWRVSTVPRYMSPGDVERLLRSCDRTSTTGRRNHAVLLLLARLGLRASEVAALELGDVRGRKLRCTPLRRDVVRVLEAWLRERPPAPDAPVFASSRGGRLSEDAVERLVAKHAAVAQQRCRSLAGKRVTPHTLRHTAAMQLLQRGVDRSVIALWLGHESIETTQMYLHADLRLKEQALARTASSGLAPGRYQPGDALLTFLESL